MRRHPALIFMLFVLLLGSPTWAKDDSPIVIWDGQKPQVRIALSQLEPLVGHPFGQQIEAYGTRAPLRWFRLRIDNRTGAPGKLQLSSLDPGTHMLVLVAQPVGVSQTLPRETISRRDHFPVSKYHRNRINLSLEPGLQTYYLGESSFLGLPNFSLITSEQRQIEDTQFTLFAGFMLGSITIIMIFALLLFAAVGHQMLLFYALYTFTLLPLLLNLSGLFGLIVSPQLTDWFERHLAMTVQLAICGLMEFSLSVLDIKKLKPRFYTVLRLQSGCAFLLTLGAALVSTDRNLFGLTQVSAAVAIISLLTIALRLSWQDMRPARFYIGGLGIFLLGSTVTLLSSLGIRVSALDSVLWFMGGTVLQLVLMPFGIRDRVQSMTEEKDQQEYQLREERALIQILAHDLSGPLFVIQSMAELQEGKQLEPKVKQSFEKIRNAAQSAQRMLKVVKELEAIESGKLELTLKSVPLLASLNSTLEILKPKAEAKQVQFVLNADIPDKLMVLGERTVLENTIFYNLVCNAIKFSKRDDRIEISVSMINNEKIAIRVRDRGIGIPETLIVKLFSYCSNTTRKGTEGEKGTGLGLPLVRRYVQKFGGSIEVQSQSQEDFPEDHWTQFTVTLKKVS